MMRIVLLLLLAVGLGGFGFIAWVAMPSSAAEEAAAQATKVTVLTAARVIGAGALLKPEDIGTKLVDVDSLPPGHVVDEGGSARLLVGGMVRRQMRAGDVLRLPTDVLRPADHGFLAAVLTPGTRAVTIAVDAVSGTAGLIWPGDRVDLILTQISTEAAEIPGRRVSAETVLRNVRVIAIDQQIVKLDSGAGPEAKTARTVTMEVSPMSAKTVQVATKLGQLSLSVRSADQEADPTGGAGITYAGDVSGALPTQAARPAISSIKVFQGSSEGKEFKF